jgi:hypothetical protein
MVAFDPYLSSRPLAQALLKAPPGKLITDGAYYPFSSIFFYANTNALLLNGRINNLEYGSYAPGAPRVFIDDAEFVKLWRSHERNYIVTEGPNVPRLKGLVEDSLLPVAAAGGKYLFTNRN